MFCFIHRADPLHHVSPGFIEVEQTFSTVEGMKLFGMCLNWKVLVGLAALAVGLYFAVSPGAFTAALPFLLAAACPLSMLLMMRFMPHGSHVAKPEPAPQPELAPASVPVQATAFRE